MTSKSKLENISAPLPKFAGTSAALKQIPLGWNRGLRIADALGHAVASPRHGRPQSSLRRLRTLVCDAGHPRLAAHSERKAWMARKSGVPDFRWIKRDRKSETSDLRVPSPAMTWRDQSATRTAHNAERLRSNRAERAFSGMVEGDPHRRDLMTILSDCCIMFGPRNIWQLQRGSAKDACMAEAAGPATKPSHRREDAGRNTPGPITSLRDWLDHLAVHDRLAVIREG